MALHELGAGWSGGLGKRTIAGGHEVGEWSRAWPVAKANKIYSKESRKIEREREKNFSVCGCAAILSHMLSIVFK